MIPLLHLLQRDLELRVDITNYCNLRCVMCHMTYQKTPPAAMSYETFRQTTEAILPRVNSLFLSWGTEPLLNKDLPRMIELSARYRVPYVILSTNLTTLPDATADALTSGNLHCLHVSLDSADADMVSTIRRNADLQTILKNIRRLRQASREKRTIFPWIVINAVLMRMNFDHFEGLIDLAASLGIREINLGNLLIPDNYPGDGSSKEQGIRLSEQEVDLHSPEVQNHLRRLSRYGARKRVFFTYPGRMQSLPGGAAGRVVATFDHLRNKSRHITFGAKVAFSVSYLRKKLLLRRAVCTYPWRQMVVTPEGNVYPCCQWHDDHSLGNTSQGTLEEIWNDRPFSSLRNRTLSDKLHPLCAKCKGTASRTRHAL